MVRETNNILQKTAEMKAGNKVSIELKTKKRAEDIENNNSTQCLEK